jgi:hypothetical protein
MGEAAGAAAAAAGGGTRAECVEYLLVGLGPGVTGEPAGVTGECMSVTSDPMGVQTPECVFLGAKFNSCAS